MNINQKNKLNWGNVLFLILSPLAAVIWGLYYTHQYGVTVGDIALFVAMFFATGLSITGGYHRLFAHVTYEAHPVLKLFFLVFGACAMENSVLHWAADHRLHHRYTDTDHDPYNAGQGFWYSHIGWIFYQSPDDRDFSVVQDLMKDPLVMWQHRNTVKIGLVAGLGLPFLVGLLTGRPGGALLWGGLIRIVFVQHATFFINSLAHMWGKQPFSRDDSSRDSWWLALITNGEGYHNFHHTFPSDYRNGLRWFQWDPTKWVIAAGQRLGLTQKLHRVPAHLILKARIRVEAIEAEQRLVQLPPVHHSPWQLRLQAAKQHLEKSLAEWTEAKLHYLEKKKNAHQHSREVLSQWKTRLREYEVRFKTARVEWRGLLRRLPQNPLPIA